MRPGRFAVAFIPASAVNVDHDRHRLGWRRARNSDGRIEVPVAGFADQNILIKGYAFRSRVWAGFGRRGSGTGSTAGGMPGMAWPDSETLSMYIFAFIGSPTRNWIRTFGRCFRRRVQVFSVLDSRGASGVPGASLNSSSVLQVAPPSPDHSATMLPLT